MRRSCALLIVDVLRLNNRTRAQRYDCKQRDPKEASFAGLGVLEHVVICGDDKPKTE
ncbi:MAG: hypothetical protein JWO13_1256 [Acidobacteriales bacterium]|nr:hypothetical protein [Terriglobales bacterium]